MQVGVAVATIITWGLLNVLRVDQQGWINNFSVSHTGNPP
jgi:hypothetical protein